jgi:hypothetical protein
MSAVTELREKVPYCIALNYNSEEKARNSGNIDEFFKFTLATHFPRKVAIFCSVAGEAFREPGNTGGNVGDRERGEPGK